MEQKKKIVNTTLIGVGIFVIVIIIGFLTLEKPEYSYKMTVNDALGCILNDSDKVVPEVAWKLVNENHDAYRLIDIRNSYDFRNGHLDDALNIPFEDILNQEYDQYLHQDNITNLFYAENEQRAIEACYLLKQMGYKNIKVVYGGYDYFTNYVLKGRQPESLPFPDDRPHFEVN